MPGSDCRHWCFKHWVQTECWLSTGFVLRDTSYMQGCEWVRPSIIFQPQCRYAIYFWRDFFSLWFRPPHLLRNPRAKQRRMKRRRKYKKLVLWSELLGYSLYLKEIARDREKKELVAAANNVTIIDNVNYNHYQYDLSLLLSAPRCLGGFWSFQEIWTKWVWWK